MAALPLSVCPVAEPDTGPLLALPCPADALSKFPWLAEAIHLVRDYANPANDDPHFPPARHKVSNGGAPAREAQQAALCSAPTSSLGNGSAIPPPNTPGFGRHACEARRGALQQPCISAHALRCVKPHSKAHCVVPWPWPWSQDWWSGNSWSNGLDVFDAGKEADSSSEAAHAYYALGLLGKALRDDSLEK